MPYSVVDWLRSPKTDLHLVRVEGEKAGKARSVDADGLVEQEMVVCFRPEELRRALGEPVQTLEAMGRLLDGHLLARVVLPTEESYDLEALAKRLEVEAQVSDGAARTSSAARLFLALVARLNQKPMAVLDELDRLLAKTDHPLRALAEAAAKQSVRGLGITKRTLRDFLPTVDVNVYRSSRPPPLEPPVTLDVAEVAAAFGVEGPIARQFAAYEYRPEQVRMVQEVSEAFNDSLVELVEAGTGTGKSLAYMVPAIQWAVKNNDPVIISTNTKNLQEQLFGRDLPFLQKALGTPFKFALIKGRGNYLCVRKFMLLLAAADRELSDAERAEILPAVTWLPLTQTGDVAELAGLKGGMDSELWARLSTQRDECLGPKCRYARHCFVRQARATAIQADVVIANHSTVFWEAGVASVALPPYRGIIFDEAHNLENVATEAFTVEVAPWSLPRVLNRLFKMQRDGAGRGHFANLRFQLSLAASRLPAESTKKLSDLVQSATDAFGELRGRAEGFFGVVSACLRGVEQRVDRVRYDADHRPEDWPAVQQAGGELVAAIEELAGKLERIQKIGDEIVERHGVREPFGSLAEVGSETGAQATFLREMVVSMDKVLKAEDESYVYWIQRGTRGEGALYAAPLDIAKLMEEMIFSKVRTAVFTSATLMAGKTFDFMRERLGIHGTVSARLREVDLGTSFDFPRQVLLAVPMFLPEPRTDGPGFVRPFCEFAIRALRASRGRALVLFTSHAMLREAYAPIKQSLAQDGIRVLGQEIDGDRSRLISVFTHETSSVLLGTSSFWEGVDVPGESLSCLIVAKLPFRVHTDPIVEARCQLLKSQGRSDFYDYMVPDAAIRLKQGFGRLIRRRTDRGVVIVCDARMLTKSYGKFFRDSLPVQARAFTREELLLRSLAEFLEGKRP